ncbi:hypothetical protein GEMRC1_008979 [Eukaryota sp. GEM-RC1]
MCTNIWWNHQSKRISTTIFYLYSQNGKDFGECHSFDPDFHGPIADRKCRDCFFALLFMIFVGAFVYVSFIYGIKEGDFNKIFDPMDRYGYVCGSTNEDNDFISEPYDLSDRPMLFFINPISGRGLAYSMCVTECPSEVGTMSLDQVYREHKDDVEGLFVVLYETRAIAGRCIPTSGNFTEVFSENFSARYLENAIDDLSNIETLKIIIGLSIVALFLGFFWLVFLRLCAAIIVWVTIIGILAAFGFAAYYYITVGISDMDSAEDVDAEQSAKTTRNIGFVLAGIFVILALIVMWMFKSIALAIDIVQEAARAIASMPLLVVFPVLIYLVTITFFSYWGYSGILLYSTAEMDYEEGFRKWDLDEHNTKYFLMFHAFSLFWIAFFISAVSLSTIAGSVAAYYFTMDKKNLGATPIWSAFWRSIRYNLGSLAFGSLIVAIVCFIKWIMKYLSKKAKQSGNKTLSGVFKCVACCLKCVEKILKYINKNAWIMIAIYNYTYCEAAKQGFNLVMRNLRRVLAITVVGDSLLFMGKLFVAIATALISTFVFHNNENIHSWQFMVGVIFLVSYLIGSMFMSVTEMAVDTIFLCFLEDCERNDGSQARPYYMTESLQSYVNKSKK